MVASVFRAIFTQPNAVSSTWDQVRDQLAGIFPKVGPLMDDAKAEVLAFGGFPASAHLQRTWSTNPLEQINKEMSAAPASSGFTPTKPR